MRKDCEGDLRWVGLKLLNGVDDEGIADRGKRTDAAAAKAGGKRADERDSK